MDGHGFIQKRKKAKRHLFVGCKNFYRKLCHWKRSGVSAERRIFLLRFSDGGFLPKAAKVCARLFPGARLCESQHVHISSGFRI